MLETVRALRHEGFELAILPVDADGLVDLDIAAAAINERAALLAVMQVNNEIGVVQPIDALVAIAREGGVPVLCDAVQGFGEARRHPTSTWWRLPHTRCTAPRASALCGCAGGWSFRRSWHGSARNMGFGPAPHSPMLCAGFGVAAEVAMKQARNDMVHVGQLWRTALTSFAGWTAGRSSAAAIMAISAFAAKVSTRRC